MNSKAKTMTEARDKLWLMLICALLVVLGIFIGCIYAAYTEQTNRITQLNIKIDELTQTNNELQEYIAKLENEVAEKEKIVQTNAQITKTIKRCYEPLPVVFNEISLLSLSTIPEEIDISKSTNITGLSADEFNELIDTIAEHREIDDCIFSGTGDSFVEVEETYGINGIYLLTIFTNESSFGEKNIRANNAAGIKIGGKYTSFDSINDCILYLGKLLKTYDEKYKRDTFSEIGDRYCPGNQDWIDDNIDVCNLYADFAYKNICEST